jgi:hypothetical protein
MKTSIGLIIGAMILSSSVSAQDAPKPKNTTVKVEREHRGASHQSTTYKPKPGMPAPVERHTVTKWRYHKGYKRASTAAPAQSIEQPTRTTETVR